MDRSCCRGIIGIHDDLMADCVPYVIGPNFSLRGDRLSIVRDQGAEIAGRRGAQGAESQGDRTARRSSLRPVVRQSDADIAPDACLAGGSCHPTCVGTERFDTRFRGSPRPRN